MEEKKRTEVSILPIINLILIVIVILGFGFQLFVIDESIIIIRENQEIIRGIQEEIRADQEEIRPIQFGGGKPQFIVDFTESNIQKIDRGFMLAKAAQAKHLTGIIFTGRIISP